MVDLISSVAPASSLSPPPKNSVPQTVRAAVLALNSVEGPNTELSVIRDPQTQRFVIVVRDRSTGDVVDQLPPEDVVLRATQLGIIPSRSDAEAIL